jgi:hypothetical protein
LEVKEVTKALPELFVGILSLSPCSALIAVLQSKMKSILFEFIVL